MKKLLFALFLWPVLAIAAPTPVITGPLIQNGLTASGSVSNDFSGSTGGFKTSTGASLFGGSSNTFTNSVVSPYFQSTAAVDPADAGVIRLANAEIIGWEANPTGTDLTLTVNSSNQFVFSAPLLSPVIAGGLTATGSSANDFSGSTGTFKTSTGVNTFGGSSNTFTNGITVNSVTASASTDLTLNAGAGTQNVVLAPTGTGIVTSAKEGKFNTGTTGEGLSIGDGTNSSHFIALRAGTLSAVGYSGNATVIEGASGKDVQIIVDASSFGTGTFAAVFKNTTGHTLLGGLTTDGTGVLQLPTGTTSAGGITLGNVNVFQSASSQLTFLAGSQFSFNTNGLLFQTVGTGIVGPNNGKVLVFSDAGGTPDYIQAANTNAGGNATLSSAGGSTNVNLTLATKGSGSLILQSGGTTTALTLDANQRSSFTPGAIASGTTAYFKVQAPADTGLTTATEAIGVNFLPATRTWVDGTVLLQEEYFFGSDTYAKTTTSATFTVAASASFGAPVAGAGVTITNPAAVLIRGTDKEIFGVTALAKIGVSADTTAGVLTFTAPSSGSYSFAAGTVAITGATTHTGSVAFNGGITATGATANDWSGGSGTFKTSTGAVTIGTGAVGISGALTVTNAATFNGTNATTAWTEAQTARTSGILPYWKLTIPADTAQTTATESPGLLTVTATRTWAAGTVAKQREYLFVPPTYAQASAGTFTEAATFAIGGAPVSGTNSSVTTDDALLIEANTTTAGAGTAPVTTNSLKILNQTGGSSHNYALQVGTLGNGLTNVRYGTTGALVLGVSSAQTDTGCTANTRYVFTTHTIGTVSLPQSYYASTRTANTSFVVTSSNATDTSTVDWVAFEP